MMDDGRSKLKPADGLEAISGLLTFNGVGNIEQQ